jgi:hypothetical protein
LTIFLGTAAFLTALLITLLLRGVGSYEVVAAAFSTACAAVAAFVMLIDAADLWVRGRRITPLSVKRMRMLVFVAVLGALAASMIGQNVMLVVILGPAMVTYLFIARKRPAGSYATRQAASRSRAGGSGGQPASSGTAKARQRRGGKKRR